MRSIISDSVNYIPICYEIYKLDSVIMMFNKKYKHYVISIILTDFNCGDCKNINIRTNDNVTLTISITVVNSL